MSTKSVLGRATLVMGSLFVGLAASCADEVEGYSPIRDAVADHASWMSFIPDDISLTALSIPGSHDSATYACLGNGTFFNYCACQSMDFSEQLASGIRGLDIRIRYRNNGTSDDTSDDYYTL